MARYTIAGLCVEMQPRFPLTKTRAEKYRAADQTAVPDMTLSGDGNEGDEHAAFARSFYTQLLCFDGLLLHSAAVALDGKAYVFSASSGTGKSTHAAFWRERFEALVINDDKPALRLIDGVFHACGTPFSGKHDLSAPLNIPLGAIVFLKRGRKTTVRPLPKKEAVTALLSQTLRPTDTALYGRLLTLLDQLLASVPLYEATVTNDVFAAQVVKSAIAK